MPVWEIVLIVLSSVIAFLILTSLSCFILTNVRLFEINFLVPFEFKLSPYRDNKEKMLKDFAFFDSQNFEHVQIKSYDGLKLEGLLLKTENSKKTAICFHGYRASAKNDFSASFKFYQSLGYNVLLVNQRSHGKSCGRVITFGVREKKDVLDWIEFVEKDLNQDEIILVGVSMGASTILMASELIKSKKVKVLIADCGFTSPYEIIKETIKTIHLPVFPTIWFINFYSILFCHINLKNHSTTKALKNSDIPTLFIHGDVDKFVPCRMSKENFDAKKDKKELLIVEGAHHAGAYVKNTNLYEQTVKKFLNKYNS